MEKKIVDFLYNELTDKEVRKAIPFRTALKIKYLGIKISKD
jgi:hypothetical protein